MAYAAFADAPVDVAVVEVGMGGTWDATNVADGGSPSCCRSRSTTRSTSATRRSTIAVEKAGIIKPGAIAVVAEQLPDVAEVLLRRAAEVGATVVREGIEFGVDHPRAGRRRPGGVAAGPARRGTTRSSSRCTARTRRRTPPSRWRRSRPSSAATDPLGEELVRAAFAEVTSPAGWRWCGAARRSCSTLPTTRTAPRPTAAALEDSFASRP